MSHEKGIEAAKEAILVSVPYGYGMTKVEASEYAFQAIKAYLDASGMVMVPRDTGPTFSDSALPVSMVYAGYDVLERCDADLMNDTGPDWDYGMQAVATYRAMISAAPNPFQTPEESREKK